MSKRKIWLNTLAVLAGVIALSSSASAVLDDATILIDRALNSPTLTVRYSGVTAAVVELKVNGASFGKRTVNANRKGGETNFTIDLSALNDGDNEIEVVLIDKGGKVVGIEKSIISTDEGTKGPVYLVGPKMGASVTGPVEIKVGFGKELKNVYVSFFIDNQFRSMSNTPPYSYVWDTAREANGWHEVEAWVVDDTSATFKSRKLKVFINNPSGRTHRRLTHDPAIVDPKKTEEPVKAPETTKVEKTNEPDLTLAPKPVSEKPAERRLSPNKVGTPLGSEISTKAVTKVMPTQVDPELIAKVEVPAITLAGVVAGNPLGVRAVGARDIKSTRIAASLATGPKYLTPTGTRVVPTKKPEAPKTPVNTKTSNPAKRDTLPHLPAPTGVVATKVEKPHKNTETPVVPVNPRAEAPKIEAEAPKLVVATKTTKPKETGVKPVIITKAEPSLIKIEKGSRLPEMGSFTIRFESDAINFDVAPSVQEGVPLTPFRHLFEKSGGEVNWNDASKEVHALGKDREIYIQIGDRVAKVNKIPVELELAPFITKGRTIVPLSFIKSTLDVEIDYDPKTNHVLITRVKK